MRERLAVMVCLVFSVTGRIDLYGDQAICGGAVQHREPSRVPQDVGLRPRSATAGADFSIVINPGPNLAANADAMAALQRAAATWEQWLQDPVTVVLDVELEWDEDEDFLAIAQHRAFIYDYDSLREKMVADAGPQEAIVASLPMLAEASVILPDSFTLQTDLEATKANFRALGFDMSYDDPNVDATLTFNAKYNFDFDASDGIEADAFDFEGVALHEIGHALGFTSSVSAVDYWMNLGEVVDVRLYTLDLFRLLPGEGAANFTAAWRVGVPGDFEPSQVFYDGVRELSLSTGQHFGDGYQASHWKTNDLTQVRLGVMDPTSDIGVHETLTASDLRALDLIGWDVVSDCNGNAIPDADEIAADPTADCNDNGLLDECEPAWESDSDSDGVSNCEDLCPQTPEGEAVDAEGCSCPQLDADSDGVGDCQDNCPDTPAGQAADAAGCGCSQRDSDDDGVDDCNDGCPGTNPYSSVDSEGCSCSQRDLDYDGVNDCNDACPGTSWGRSVDWEGCACNQMDEDDDDVDDCSDECPATAPGQAVDSKGCSCNQRDSDGDGVDDCKDDCTGTPLGTSVDSKGCSQQSKPGGGEGGGGSECFEPTCGFGADVLCPSLIATLGMMFVRGGRKKSGKSQIRSGAPRFSNVGSR